ncbi:MAG: class C sortase [Bacilli bacterium]|nr:class C sortase [Bacilli bacterium]
MKKHKITFILILFFFIGLLILTYPMISDYFNQKTQSRVITDYESLLNNLEIKDYSLEFDKATDYNNRLKDLANPLLTYDTLNDYNDYNDILNINSNGMMGYITIDKIKVELPIYHGTSKDVLSTAVGHIEGTSIPVGGSYTHSVLSAHRGLPSSKLFTDLDKLEIGDIFTITVLDKVLTYEVDKISIVKPNEIDELKIDENDYVTLSTCTPYGINTHRLLVRGKRIENIEAKKKYITTEAFKIDNLIVTPLVAIPIILILLLIIVFKPVEKTKINIDKYIYPSKKEEK